uniref:Endosulfine alpha n=1 Tax=Serinus canaria TaxID=9135 RepID=A0A8C9MET3_SERCA
QSQSQILHSQSQPQPQSQSQILHPQPQSQSQSQFIPPHRLPLPLPTHQPNPFSLSQQKYFDSGDYNMAKAKMKNKQLPSAGPDRTLVTGDHIPRPQDLPQRKSSLLTSKLAG